MQKFNLEDFMESETLRKKLDDADYTQDQRMQTKDAQEVYNKGVSMQKIRNEAASTISDVLSEGRSMMSTLEKILEKQEQIEDYRESEEFEDDKDKGFVDYSHYRELWQLCQLYRRGFDHSTYMIYNILPYTVEMHDKLDTQKSLSEASEVLENTKKMQEGFKDAVDEMSGRMEEGINRIANQVLATSRQQHSQQDQLITLMRDVLDLFEGSEVVADQEQAEKLRQRVSELKDTVEEYESRPQFRELMNQHGLNPTQAEIVRLMVEEDLTEPEIADRLNYDKGAISRFRDKEKFRRVAEEFDGLSVSEG